MPVMEMREQEHKQALPSGHIVGSYRLHKVLGVGGFGVTYMGEHMGLAHMVAIKEYLPSEFAVRDGAAVHPKSDAGRVDFAWGLERFIKEGRTLTKFRHPNIVKVLDLFKANNTAYIVMEYEDGLPLDVLLARHGTLTEEQLKRVVLPIADGLRQVHAAGFLHRDIKPANIYVRRADESPVLLDFGAARQALGGRSKSMTSIASAGYSPPEQYESGGKQGSWVDIYALSALCRRAITGEAPLDATTRLNRMLHTQRDPLPDLTGMNVSSYSTPLLKTVDQGLRLLAHERPQRIEDWVAQATEKHPSAQQEKTSGAPVDQPVRHASAASEDSQEGFWQKLAGGKFGLAKTYWLFDFLAFLLITFIVFSVSYYSEQVPLYPPAWLTVVQSTVAALSLAHIPYTFIVAVGVWNSASLHQGPKIWGVLARAHVTIKALTFAVRLFLDLQTPNSNALLNIQLAWPILAIAFVIWVGWAMIRWGKRSKS